MPIDIGGEPRGDPKWLVEVQMFIEATLALGRMLYEVEQLEAEAAEDAEAKIAAGAGDALGPADDTAAE